MEYVYEIEDAVQIYRYPMPAIDSNMYVILDKNTAFIVDPNVNNRAVQFLKENHVTEVFILLTHEHFDHISGVNLFKQEFRCKVLCSKEASAAITCSEKNLAKYWDIVLMDKSPEEIRLGASVKDENYMCEADLCFSDEFLFSWGEHTIKLISAPGHSKGSVLAFFDDVLFTGDSLVNGTGVICRFPGGKWKTYCEKTLPLIAGLADTTMIFPGHGKPDILKNLRKYLIKFKSGDKLVEGKL